MKRNELEYRHNLDQIDAERERRDRERVRQEAYEEGYAEGFEQGILVGEIQVAQQWLRLPVTSRESLFALTNEDLERLNRDLLRRLVGTSA